MMGQTMLLTSTYILVLGFFWLLFMSMAVVHRLRQARLERIESGITYQDSKNSASKQILRYVHSPLDEMQAWHNAKPQDKAERIPGPMIFPLRYQQTLLFADELADTHPNPALKAS